MKKNTVVKFDEISVHFKQRLMLRFRQHKTLIDVETENGLSKAIEIWYNCNDYAVMVDDRILGILEWDSCLDTECEEEIESDFKMRSPDEFPEDVDDLFYS